jgi:ABC-type multidrug transport system ATPase subunit
VERIASREIIIDGGKIKVADTPQNLISEMRAAGRIQVEFQSPAEVATPLLAELPHVKKVSSEELEDGWIRFMVWVDSGTDTRQTLSTVASHNHWPLRSLFLHETTLEDVFVELTRKD